MKSKTKLVLVSLFLFFLSLIFAFFLVFLLKKIQEVSSKILQIKREDLTLTQRVELIEEFERIKNEKKEEFSKLENLLFSKELPLPFVTFLEQAAKEKGLSIEISTQEPPKTKRAKETEPFPSLYFIIKVRGSFESIFAFLKKVEKSQFLVEFEKLRISKVEEGKNLESEVLIKAFVKE